jgi:hypothetical protein
MPLEKPNRPSQTVADTLSLRIAPSPPDLPIGRFNIACKPLRIRQWRIKHSLPQASPKLRQARKIAGKPRRDLMKFLIVVSH